MPCIRSAVALLVAAAVGACSPSLNWREVVIESSSLKAMMPCKPDKATREVPIAGESTSLQAYGCEAQGATFAVFHADVRDPSKVAPALMQWRLATLANLHAATGRDAPFAPPGAQPIAASVQVAASGRRSDGAAVESRAAYFAQGTHIFQAVVYAARIQAEMADPFFSGLQFQ